MNFYNFLVCLDTFSRKKNSHHGRQPCQQLRPVLIVLELAPLTLRKIKKTTKPPGRIQKLQKCSRPPPPGQGEVGISKMAQVPEGEFAHHTRPVGEQLCIDCHNLKQFKTVHKRIRQNRCNRYTIHQSRIIFPHTQLRTDSRGKG